MGDRVIQVDHLRYTYPDGTIALRDVSFTIGPGERVGLVGANGSGKSTLLLHLNGILTAQSGTVQVGDWLVNAQTLRLVRDFVGMVFQNPEDQLFMPLVREDVAFGAMNQGVTGKALIDCWHRSLWAVGLDPQVYGDRNVYQLSGGEQKRVAIAGVLAMQPQVLALDEPSAQLDPRSRRQLIRLLTHMPLTQLIASHDLDLILALCPRTIVLHQGRVVADGTTLELFQDDRWLEEQGLEAPLSYQRPYCRLEDRPMKENRDL